jgi:mRNA-degrading endonuclease RelE of RelBE toxin-antitoxin system
MDSTIKVENTCSLRKDFCDTCNSHFMELRPSIKEVVISKHFRRDLKDENKIALLVKNILDCSHVEFHELHKFEENINDNLIFRARKDKMHILYCITKDRKMLFLRAIRNYDEYKKLLDNKKELKKMIES